MFAGGTQLQHALYAAAVEQKFRLDGTDPDAEVAVSSYRFPTERGLGEEAERRRDPEKLAALLRNMLGAINAGMFPPTDDPGMCAWCDYRDACGAHAEWMKEKLSANDNARKLAPVLEVRGHA
jgi:CRISPR/Cas system-associated exonuclease Cas4 (RecB family)